MSQLSKKAIASKLLQEYSQLLRCPICKKTMIMQNDQSLVCEENHHFDLAKKGYVHLLSQSIETKYDKELFQSRKRIAEDGFFAPLIKSITKIIDSNKTNAIMLDAGCGEGSHLAQIQQSLEQASFGIGADIAKEGIQLATSNSSNSVWIVADLANLPIATISIDYILNILSPSNYAEFDRLLKKEGKLIKVIPNSDYLKELRGIFYEDKEAYDNESTKARFQEKFELLHTEQVRYSVNVKQPLLNDLVKMTPLSWSADKSKVEEVNNTESMNITVDLSILVGIKK